MSFNRKDNLYTWIALSISIIAATTAIVIPSLSELSSLIKLLLAILSWILIICSALFLFFQASKAAYNKESESDTGGNEKNLIQERKKSERKNTDRLDVQSASRKIIRKANISDDKENWGKQLLNVMVSELEIMSGVVYVRNEKNIFEAKATYALPHLNEPYEFKEGEGLSGQAALNQNVKFYDEIPKYYTKVFSGLGSGNPSYLAMIPLLINEKCISIIEIAGFRWKSEQLKQLFDILSRDLSNQLEEQAKDKNG